MKFTVVSLMGGDQDPCDHAFSVASLVSQVNKVVLLGKSTRMLNILYQDEYLAAVDKPPGMLVHPGRDPEPDDCIAMKVLRDQLDRYVYPLHRLDRPTSGVLLFALDPDMHKIMHAQFEERKIQKSYWAAVQGKTDVEWECTEPLRKDETAVLKECHTRFNRLRYHPPGHFPACAWLEVSLVEAEPLTGRHHQIRRHLAGAGFPIVGDYLYGDIEQNEEIAEKLGMTRMMLHAASLRFMHPSTGAEVFIEAPPPPEFAKFSA